MQKKYISFLFFFMLFFTYKSNAAFIVKETTISKECNFSYVNSIKTITTLKQYELNNHDRFIHHRQNKKKWAAILLSLPILGFCLFGIHRFYLGYVGQGLAQLLSFAFAFSLVFFAIDISFSTTLIVVGYFLGIFLLLGILIWELVDFIRICSGNLKPKHGDYDRPNRNRY